MEESTDYWIISFFDFFYIRFLVHNWALFIFVSALTFIFLFDTCKNEKKKDVN